MQLLVGIRGPSALWVVPAVVRWARLHKKRTRAEAKEQASQEAAFSCGLCIRFLPQVPPWPQGWSMTWDLNDWINSFVPKFLLATVLSQQQNANQKSKEFSSFPRYFQGVPYHTVICNVKFCSLLTVLHIAGFFILVIINLFFIYTLSHQKSSLKGQMFFLILFFKG